MEVVANGESEFLRLFESDGEEIYEVFRAARARRVAAQRAKQARSSWRFRITLAAITAVVSFTLLTALRFLPVH